MDARATRCAALFANLPRSPCRCVTSLCSSVKGCIQHMQTVTAWRRARRSIHAIALRWQQVSPRALSPWPASPALYHQHGCEHSFTLAKSLSIRTSCAAGVLQQLLHPNSHPDPNPRSLNALLQEQHGAGLLRFVDDSWEQAAALAAQQSKGLLLYLHSPEHEVRGRVRLG